jgi:hypothetical protein
MTHDYHKDLLGYDERQILFDGGCQECDERGRSPRLALAHLDNTRARYAWERAAAWQAGREELTGPISANESGVLQMLFDVQVVLERAAGVPIGVWPGFIVEQWHAATPVPDAPRRWDEMISEEG